jgi:soluble lytic murein transglycosylase-like protein
MSLVDVLHRIDQIQAMLQPPATPTPAPSESWSYPVPAAGTSAALSTGTAFGDVLAAQTRAPAEGRSVPYEDLIRDTASRNDVDPALVEAVVRHESGFDPAAVSRAGAQGLMQLMPGTARGLGVTDPFDPAQSIDGGTRYLRDMLDRFGGDTRLALAAYNAGPWAVERYGGVPPYAETQTYVERVLGTYQQASDERRFP